MKATPLVSVVLPTLNRAAMLPRSVGSVLAQSFRDFELIVVDDGSTEDIRSVVEAFHDPRLVYVRRPMRGGVATARNTGVHAARGKYLAFQDSDDEWLLNKLELQLATLEQAGPDFDMNVCGLLRFGGQELRAYPLSMAAWDQELRHETVLTAAFVYTQTWLVPRAAVLEAGGFDESMRIWDDWELLMRLSKRVRICTLGQPLVVSEKSPDSLSVVAPRWVSDLSHILQKHAEYLQTRPREYGRLTYLLARILMTEGRSGEGRKMAMLALRRDLRQFKAWVLLGLSLTPTLARSVLK